jgi:hypothetical protein
MFAEFFCAASRRDLSKATVFFTSLLSIAFLDRPVANAAVIIRSFHFKLCVTDKAHPEECKETGADVTALVSADTLDTLKSEIGQGATIEAVVPKGYALPSSNQGHRHRNSTPQ